MPGNNPIHISGRGVAVIVGVLSLIGTFAPGTGIGFLGRVGLLILGAFFILVGIR